MSCDNSYCFPTNSEASSSTVPVIHQRVVIIGHRGCGKTSLVNLLLGVPFDTNLESTSFPLQHQMLLQHEGTHMNLRVWDVPEKSMLMFVTRRYREPQVVIAMYDSDNLLALYKLKRLIEYFVNRCQNRSLLRICLVGNKIDLQRTVPIPLDLHLFLNHHQVDHYFISVRMRKGIDILIRSIVNHTYLTFTRMGLVHHVPVESRVQALPHTKRASRSAVDNNNHTPPNGKSDPNTSSSPSSTPTNKLRNIFHRFFS